MPDGISLDSMATLVPLLVISSRMTMRTSPPRRNQAIRRDHFNQPCGHTIFTFPCFRAMVLLIFRFVKRHKLAAAHAHLNRTRQDQAERITSGNSKKVYSGVPPGPQDPSF